MRKSVVGGFASVCIWLLALTGVAAAATGPQTFRIIFTGDPHAGAVGRVVAYGVVQGLGVDRNVGHVDNPDGSSTDLDQISLPAGTITIEDVERVTSFDVNPVTCLGRVTAGGTFRVVGSTGAYAGATGSGTFTARATLLFNRTATGCSEEPLLFYADVLVTGRLTVP